jgi:endoglucanase
MSSNHLSRRALVGGALSTAAAAYASNALAGPAPLKAGVNIAGLEFRSSKLPGKLNVDYPAPKAAEIAYYRSRGARTLRLPFLWERLQPTLMGRFDQPYLALIDGVVSQAQSLGMTVVLDAHQYGRRRQNGQSYIIGETTTVTAQHFAHMWRWLANRYKSRPVIYGLTNEPHDQDKAVLVNVQNTAIAAIRAAGGRQLVLASGSAWSGAHSWVSSGNGEAMLGIRDPANNYAFDVHQYLDSNASGTSGTCVVNPGNRLSAFTAWARQNHKRGFLGEFGWGANAACNTEMTKLLSHIRDNRDVWLGWTAWAGGIWWADSYYFNLRPTSLTNPVDKPQMALLRQYWA